MHKDSILLTGLKKMASHPTPISYGQLMAMFNHHGPFLILTILSAFFCIPIQIPGLSTPFGLLIAWMAIRILLSKNTYRPPRWMSKKKINSTLLKKAARGLLHFFRKIAPIIRPRLKRITSHPATLPFSCTLIFILGLLLSLPLPIPGTNLFTAVPLLCISLATLKEDGFLLITGYILSFATFTLFAALFFFGFRLL